MHEEQGGYVMGCKQCDGYGQVQWQEPKLLEERKAIKDAIALLAWLHDSIDCTTPGFKLTYQISWHLRLRLFDLGINTLECGDRPDFWEEIELNRLYPRAKPKKSA